MNRLPSHRQAFAWLRSLAATAAALALLVGTEAWADLKMRPKEKIRETPKDFRKDNEKYGFPTPEPKAMEVNFVAGKPVDIVLEASTRYLGSVKFEIRDKPQHGTLSVLRPVAGNVMNKVIVTYTHGGDPEAISDQFTFVARIGEGSTSVPATVTLKGRRAMPKLEVAENPRFKKLKPGDTDSGKAVVKNVGDAAFDGLITWPAPFFGPPKMTIAPGAEQEFLVQVKVAAVGSYSLSLQLQPGEEGSRLKSLVDCVLPYVISPSSLELKFDSASGQRKGKAKVTNASDTQLTLRLDPDARVKTAEMLILDPKATVDLDVALSGDDTAPFRGEVWVMQGQQKEKLFLSAEPEPPQARLVVPADGKIDFGTVEKGKHGEAKFVVANDGGAELILSALDSPPFVVPQEVPLKVAPGTTAEFMVKFETDQGGAYSKPVNISGNGGQLTLNLKGTLNDPRRVMQPGRTGPGVENPRLDRTNPTRQPASRPSATEKKVSTAPPVVVPPSLSNGPSKIQSTPPEGAPQSAATEPTGSAAAGTEPPNSALRVMEKLSPKAKAAVAYGTLFGFGKSDIPEHKSPTLTKVEEIGLLEAGKDELVIRWKNPTVEPAHYQLEVPVRMKGKEGITVKAWKPVDGWTPATAPDGMSAARIAGLAPAARYEFRVCGVDADGKLSPPSDIIMANTLPPMKLPVWVWSLLISLVVLAGLLIVRQRMNAR